MRNVVIFGGSGFVGYHLTRMFLESEKFGHLYIADIKKPRTPCQENISYIPVDIRNPITVTLFDKKIDCIINLAAIHTTPGHEAHEYFEANIKGATHICQFAEHFEVDTMVFTSSISVYGPGEDRKNEKSIPMPVIPYGSSKIIAEYIHKEWYTKKPHRSLTILRPAVIFGKYENGNFTRISHLLHHGIFAYIGRKDTIKSCCYVKDVCRYILWRLDSEKGYYCNNFCYPKRITIEHICNTFSKALHYKKTKFTIPLWFIGFIVSFLRKIEIQFLLKRGIHPDRFLKLVHSTNISSEALINDGFQFKYPLHEALLDWHRDCMGKKLY